VARISEVAKLDLANGGQLQKRYRAPCQKPRAFPEK
jgi:hypothetical protein